MVRCGVVDRGTANLREGVFYFYEILPVSNFWQLHTLPPPSTTKMMSSCAFDNMQQPLFANFAIASFPVSSPQAYYSACSTVLKATIR